MGYTTEFNGQFKFNTTVSSGFRNYINAFSETRHMKRNVDKIKEVYPHWEYNCFNGNLGTEGEYFIETDGDLFGNASIIEVNEPARTQPGLWCQWRVTDDCSALEWDGVEKFYKYTEWLQYLIDNFIGPCGYKLNGDVEWQGEESDDRGIIHVVNNKITTEKK